jgi:Xaa-Pro dipeptidase
LPHGIPGDRAVQAGELLLIDFGTSVDGYHCDITRTFVVGSEPSAKTREVYDAVLAANARGRAAAKPGITAGEVHAAAQNAFKDPKYAGYLTHRTGHGLGLDIHEGPSLMEGNDERLQASAVMTIEPGLYEEGWGGVRIEDDVLLTEGGAESLTLFPRDLQVIGGR